MNETDIFNHLFSVAAQSKDPRGVVAACLIEDGVILISKASSDDGIHHAEDLLFAECIEKHIPISKNTTLYATLEPCTKRSRSGMTDCVSHIIASGIGHVVFGARDPDHSATAKTRLNEAGISIQQMTDPDVVRRCAKIFNQSVTKDHAGIDVQLKPEN